MGGEGVDESEEKGGGTEEEEDEEKRRRKRRRRRRKKQDLQEAPAGPGGPKRFQVVAGGPQEAPKKPARGPQGAQAPGEKVLSYNGGITLARKT